MPIVVPFDEVLRPPQDPDLEHFAAPPRPRTPHGLLFILLLRRLRAPGAPTSTGLGHETCQWTAGVDAPMSTWSSPITARSKPSLLPKREKGPKMLPTPLDLKSRIGSTTHGRIAAPDPCRLLQIACRGPRGLDRSLSGLAFRFHGADWKLAVLMLCSKVALKCVGDLRRTPSEALPST